MPRDIDELRRADRTVAQIMGDIKAARLARSRARHSQASGVGDMNRGLLDIVVIQRDGRAVKVGSFPRSAIHAELSRRETAGLIDRPVFYLGYNQTTIVAVGIRRGASKPTWSGVSI